MRLLNFKQLKLAEDLVSYINNSLLETNFSLPKNTFLDKLEICKLLIEKNNNSLVILNNITKELIKNSTLNIEIQDVTIILFCVAAFAVNELEDNQHINKTKFEIEIKSILEELKLLGVGNNLVKNLSKCFKIIFKLNKPLENILSFIKENKISLTDFDGMANYLDKNLSKLSQKDKNTNYKKVLSINEFTS